MINQRINQLINYGIKNNLLESDDKFYSANRMLKIFNLRHFTWEETKDISFEELIHDMTDYALEKKILESDTINERDAFEAMLIDCLLPRPSDLNRIFRSHYKKSPQQATKFFHDFSLKTNYIKTSRIEKNLVYQYPGKYGDLDITINLSKPEKDPMDIKKASMDKTKYPTCPLCMENVGVYQSTALAPRSNHRVVSLSLNNEKETWGMQYSPYAYFNEHVIVLRKKHSDMYVNDKSFDELIDFVNKFPHYLIGSNAGLPIVGGSILSHHHFQGGRHVFPMEKARVVKKYKKNRVRIEILDWPMPVIRFVSNNENRLLDVVKNIFQYWQSYSDEKLNIKAHTDQDHNTVTPIVRVDGANFNFYMILRNNQTTKDLPYGLYHPDPKRFHIKKENIGLIEVMGLAILPGRLLEELEMIKEVLLNGKLVSDFPELKKHEEWVKDLKSKPLPEDLDQFLKMEIGHIFEQVLEDANVFKFGSRDDLLSFVEKAI